MNFIFFVLASFPEYELRKMSEANLTNESNDADKAEGARGENLKEDNSKDICIHCGNNPCMALELYPMLRSILQTYGGWKTNKQICFRMYSDVIKAVHGPSLGKRDRKRHPQCVQKKIRALAPDEKYMGFREVSSTE